MSNNVTTQRRGGGFGLRNSRRKESNESFYVLSVFFLFEYLRPQDSFLGFLGALKIPMLLSILLLIVFLKSDHRIIKENLIILMLFFIAEIAVSILYATNTYFVYRGFKGMALMAVIIIAIPIVIDSAKRFYEFINVWLVIHILLAIYVLFHNGRGPGGFLGDENDLALTLVMVIPLSAVMYFHKGVSIKQKFFYVVISILCVIGVISSMSRGGFVGLASIAILFWWFSHHKIKRLFQVISLVILFGYPVHQLVPDSYKAEVSSISDTSDKTRNSRFFYWGLGWQMFLDNPILGVGAMNYGWNVAEYQMNLEDFDPDERRLLGGRAAHSLYFTLISELGAMGAIIYVLIVIGVLKRLNRIVELGKQSEYFYNVALMARGLKVSLFAFFITGTFISVLYYPPFWYLMGIVLALDLAVTKMQSGQKSEDGLLVEEIIVKR